MAKFSVCSSISFALIATLLIVAVESTGESSERLIGGERARPNQFPHQVSIRSVSTISHICAGAIISRNAVLTTAKCMQGPYSNPSNVYIKVGSIFLTHYQGTLYNVSRILNHPRYNAQTTGNDISVIKTMRIIAFNDLVKTINLPTMNVVNGVAATISGWGRHDVSTVL